MAQNSFTHPVSFCTNKNIAKKKYVADIITDYKLQNINLNTKIMKP